MPTRRSVSLPIALASLAVALAIALLVGWTLLIVRNQSLSREVASNTWLLVLGIVAFAVIMTVLVTVSVFLVREIQEIRSQTQFIDSVTHELRSPLASLKLCLETLARPELAAEQRERLRAMMHSDVDRLSGFIDDVLETSRLAHGRTSHRLAEVQLRAVADRAAQSTERRFELAPGTITVEVAPGLTLHSDENSLELVLRNLLDNAVKYSATPPQVRVRAAAGYDGSTVRVEVEDRGLGLSRQHLRRVFQRFYRVDSEAVRTRHGTGLGLYVVAELLRSMGGRIEARSAGEGQGTTMIVTLNAGSNLRSRGPS